MSHSAEPYGLHHVNFPSTDLDRTAEWYGKVFGLRRVDVSRWTPDTEVLLLTRENFDLHFTPTDEVVDMAPYHFAVEVQDWSGFLEHLGSLGIRYAEPVERPQNRSKFSYIRDPDGTLVEIVYHDRSGW